MIDCPFLAEDQSCRHVSAGVGLAIIVSESACRYCVKNYRPEDRAKGYVVECWIHKERSARGMEAGAIPLAPRKPTTAVARREYKPRPNIADEVMAVARSVPRIAPAPVIIDAEARLEVCEECHYWKREKCTAGCNCRTRPRPLAETGKDCPIKLWRRA